VEPLTCGNGAIDEAVDELLAVVGNHLQAIAA
jgi:hypothetical protein